MPSPETLPYNPEAVHSAERLRNPLVEAIVEHSKGTVGLMLSAEFSEKQKGGIISAIKERDETTTPGEGLLKPGNGIANYGERPIYSNGDNLGTYEESIGQFGKNNEELHFFDLGNGKVDVRYSFAAPGYTDEGGRPGNILRSGFIVLDKEAKQLHEAVSNDPRVMDELLAAQMNGIGIEDETWEKIKPRYGYDPSPNRNPNLATSLDDDKRRTVIFEHNTDGSVKEREEVVLGKAKERLKIAANIETDEHAKEAFEAMEYYYMMARGQEIEPDKILNPADYKNMEGANDMVREAAEEVLALNVPYAELEKLLKTVRAEFEKSV